MLGHLQVSTQTVGQLMVHSPFEEGCQGGVQCISALSKPAATSENFGGLHNGQRNIQEPESNEEAAAEHCIGSGSTQFTSKDLEI